ncbi:uncharacterized protein LOC130724799 [Lotus japonicus]|uniref:uncharacterized protein LOC130724799 n=1 Tax=Lotus japonicus TaxID=34305 RepID=UPI0025894C0D|nr:uncharacterized protein LOC130724799 [Lotus japonicus]
MTSWVDELANVFKLLPAFIVCRFKCVGKLFDYTTNPKFCAEQASHMLSLGDQHIFTSPGSHIIYDSGIHLLHLLHNGPSDGVPKDFLDFIEQSGQIISSWNGLVVVRCRRKNPFSYFICNPVTSSWTPLTSPCPNYYVEGTLNIIIIPSSTPTANDYRLLSMIRGPSIFKHYYVLKEYNPVGDYWQVINPNMGLGDRNVILGQPAIVNNWLYFMSDNYEYSFFGSDRFYLPYVVAYSLHDHTSVLLDLPIEVLQEPFDGKFGVYTWGSRWTSRECLCLVRFINSSFSVWTCADSTSIIATWVQILHITKDELGLSGESFSLFSMYVEPIRNHYTVVNGDCLIFATRDKIYAYNINGPYPWKFCQVGINESRTNVILVPYSSTFRIVHRGHSSSFKEFLANNLIRR